MTSKSRPSRLLLLPLLGVAFACVTTWEPLKPQPYHRVEPIADAGERVGVEECEVCHESSEGHRMSSEAHGECEDCHGPGESHSESERVASIRFPSNDDCLGCHSVGSDTLYGWNLTRHAEAGILCSDCHNTHNRELGHVRGAGQLESAMLRDAGEVTRLCSSCHPEITAQLELPSHHPMREGMLGCTDCHAPHTGDDARLGSPTHLCGSCHQETTGPWIYEHAPVTEDCGYCHEPHGAVSNDLLSTSQPAACISCHTVPISGAAHDPWAFATPCTDCHNAVHGSHSDRHLRR